MIFSKCTEGGLRVISCQEMAKDASNVSATDIGKEK